MTFQYLSILSIKTFVPSFTVKRWLHVQFLHARIAARCKNCRHFKSNACKNCTCNHSFRPKFKGKTWRFQFCEFVEGRQGGKSCVQQTTDNRQTQQVDYAEPKIHLFTWTRIKLNKSEDHCYILKFNKF